MQRLDASDLDSSKLNLKPTWGISFGLPETGGGSYPIGPHGDNVLVNPYRGYGTADQGINIGLVSVNPLLAVQFTKDEYGEKVVKPFVNLHVTPNRYLVQKLGHLLSQKKEALFDNYGTNYAPHYYPSKPIEYHEKPYHVKPPRYPPHHYNGHHEIPYPNHQYSDYYRGDNDDDYDYDYDYENYRGTARSKEPSTGKVSFPSRRKREVQLSKDATEVSIDESRMVVVDIRKENVSLGRANDSTTRHALSTISKGFTRITLPQQRQFLGAPRACGPGYVCCSKRQPIRKPQPGQCGVRYTQGVNGRIKTPSYVDGDAEFGRYFLLFRLM